MTQPLNSLFSLQEQALTVHGQRLQLLSSNLANADTPGFKARDIDFKAALDQAQGVQQGVAMETTSAGHMQDSSGMGSGEPELLYRNPTQPSIDGNTVDSQIEMSKYMENSMDFQASFQFLNSSIQGLKKAITGE